MKEFFYSIYVAIFAKKSFLRFNRFIMTLGMKGVGINNYETLHRSGEYFFIKKWISKKFNNPVIFDVGANVGKYSSLIDFKSQVHAFEPVLLNYQSLKKRFLNKDRVKTYNFGFSNRGGKVTIYDKDKDGTSHASLFKDALAGMDVYSEEIQVKTIDEFCGKNNIKRIHFLKIDTEGNEFNVLSGAERMLKEDNIDVIQFEFGSHQIYAGNFLRDYISLLTNFKFYRLLPNEILDITYERPEMEELFFFQNIIAIRKNL